VRKSYFLEAGKVGDGRRQEAIELVEGYVELCDTSQATQLVGQGSQLVM